MGAEDDDFLQDPYVEALWISHWFVWSVISSHNVTYIGKHRSSHFNKFRQFWRQTNNTEASHHNVVKNRTVRTVENKVFVCFCW